MTIWRVLKDSQLKMVDKQLLNLAYRRTLEELDLPDSGDLLCRVVAHKVVEVGARSEPDDLTISETALRELRLSWQSFHFRMLAEGRTGTVN